MPSPKVFVSSTCYDLGMVREQVRTFIKALGYEPIMSEYSDVLFDYRKHTHTNCIQEIPNADMIILLIGRRFGGTAIPEALNQIEIEKLSKMSYDISALTNPEKLSITQLEILHAINNSIPVFAFIDESVLHDHLVYEKNKDLIGTIHFPSIEKQESAKFIFEFINFLRNRTQGNSVIPFSRNEDIENHLKKQWASLFQRLLQEQRSVQSEDKKSNNILEKIDDLKAAVLSSIESNQSREVARGVIRYRKLYEFLSALTIPLAERFKNIPFDELLKIAGIVETITIPHERQDRIALVKSNRAFYELRLGKEYLSRIQADWAAFTVIPAQQKEVIFDALSENNNFNLGVIRFRDSPIDELIIDATDSTPTLTKDLYKLNPALLLGGTWPLPPID